MAVSEYYNYTSQVIKPEPRKVLVINTGGTFGMKKVDGVLKPASEEEVLEKLISKKILTSEEGVEAKVLTIDPPLDSSEMDGDDWVKIAECIKDHYESYDGFVIIHGTDTLANSASALSFMLQNLAKPVVITGAQISIFEDNTDGLSNLAESIAIAGNFRNAGPKVMVFFHNSLLQGNRCVKFDSDGLDAFFSPHKSPIEGWDSDSSAGADFDKDNNEENKVEELSIITNMSPNVIVLRLYPGITREAVQCLRPCVQGVVLQTYGKGNAPNNKGILEELRKACKRGVLIVNISQCIKGKVEPTYGTGSALVDVGVIPGGDMTSEAAHAKLCYVIGGRGPPVDEHPKTIKARFSHDCKMVLSSLCCEMTPSSEKEVDSLIAKMTQKLWPKPHI